MTMKSYESIARMAYEEFCDNLGQLTVPLLAWNDLPEKVRVAWIEVVRFAAAEIQQVH